jgi:hypothetical protein
MGGEISCQSIWGEGTNFTFTIKLEPCLPGDQIDEQMRPRSVNPNNLRTFPRVCIEDEINLRLPMQNDGSPPCITEDDLDENELSSSINLTGETVPDYAVNDKINSLMPRWRCHPETFAEWLQTNSVTSLGKVLDKLES